MVVVPDTAPPGKGTVEWRADQMENVLGGLSPFRALRIHSLCAQSLHRDVSLTQLVVLGMLHERGSMTVTAVAGVLDVSLPSASTIVDRLEDRGYVLRTREGTDRRVVTVEITERGRGAVEEFMGLKREEMMRLMGAMSDRELGRFVEGMAALRSAVERVGTALTAEANTEAS